MSQQMIERLSITSSGRRLTRQRALLLDLIYKRGGHVDADELYRMARDRLPNLSLSTVYRTLQLFKEMGLVRERHFDESHHHYEPEISSEHHHLICIGCGEIFEFSCPLTQQMKLDIGNEKDFDIIDTEVRMTGYCASCRHKKDV